MFGPMIVYGIKNCDTVKKALSWLENHDVAYEFHDFKKLGVSEEKLKEWSSQLGWEALLNKRGTTWRKLDPSVQNSITSEDAALQLMRTQTSVIKRPVIESGNQLLHGFDEELYTQKLL